jgi:transposase InsO family protein
MEGLQVRIITENWLEEYNTLRPHDALQGLSPRQFAPQYA